MVGLGVVVNAGAAKVSVTDGVWPEVACENVAPVTEASAWLEPPPPLPPSSPL